MTLLLVWMLREDVFLLPSALALCPYRMMPADFTQGRQYITLTGSIQEKKHLLYFSRKLSVSQWCLWAFIQCIVTWISRLGYFGNEHSATFWLQDVSMGEDTVPNKVTGRVHMTAGVHPTQHDLDSQELWHRLSGKSESHIPGVCLSNSDNKLN